MPRSAFNAACASCVALWRDVAAHFADETPNRPLRPAEYHVNAQHALFKSPMIDNRTQCEAFGALTYWEEKQQRIANSFECLRESASIQRGSRRFCFVGALVAGIRLPTTCMLMPCPFCWVSRLTPKPSSWVAKKGGVVSASRSLNVPACNHRVCYSPDGPFRLPMSN